MSDVVMRVEGLGKKYRIGGAKPRYRTLRESLSQSFRSPFVRAGRLLRGEAYGAAGMDEVFWALRDVSFEVSRGEVVGVIGRNGAGKSTLLKILSRITVPTEGFAEVHGRVGSLLEVGTGFHPELTGRENILLNGAILGMSRAEVLGKFDEIVAFSEVGKFIDTPVKFYSSGMYVRLAFSVAAHFEPEVLLVDEVLAVGDFAFQQKCLGKMRDVSSEGRTILFVSHNLGAISRLTERSILLDSGVLTRAGPTQSVVQEYVAGGETQRAEYIQPHARGKRMNLLRVAVCDRAGIPTERFGYHDRISCVIDYEVNTQLANGLVAIGLFGSDGTCAFVTGDFDAHPELLETRASGEYTTQVQIPEELLSPGRYSITVYLTNSASGEIYDEISECVSFTIVETGSPGSRLGVNQRRGILQPILPWTTRRMDT